MKTLAIFLIFLTNNYLTFAQANISGNYKNNFGNTLKLLSDSTFRFTWSFDLAASWTNGNWSVKRDTLYFNPIFVYDTVSLFNKENVWLKDTLVLSFDEKSNKIKPGEIILNEVFSSGQNRCPVPSKLFFRNNKLYEIDKFGRLIKKKKRGFLSKKKYIPWYFRKE